MKKLTCHCGKIEAEVKIPKSGIEKIIEFSLTNEEKSALENTLDAVKKTVEGTKL